MKSDGKMINQLDWDQLIEKVCLKVSEATGNILSEKQRPMVESRMKRRLLDLNLSPSMYQSYWMKNFELENKHLIGLLTTHFTAFFREFSHFEWIEKELPEIVRVAKSEGRTSIKFWSAACSKGQEVWSLAMWLYHLMQKIDPEMGWTVYGTDIDSGSVKEAMNGVYHRREIETAPRHLWQALWLRGKDDISDWYKVKNELRVHTKFATDNLLSLSVPESDKYDCILCRNVLIYFNSSDQSKIVRSLIKRLTPNGVLITGVSESLNGFDLPLKCLAPSVYKELISSKRSLPIEEKNKSSEIKLPKPIEVFCIDDSPTILNILKNILSGPSFKVIGTASNGEDAVEKLKNLTPDVITLDLHMPIMDGTTFLSKTLISKEIPVVIVSSVNRDDQSIVAPLFSLGVKDFVEKPSLTNMQQIKDELDQKIKMALRRYDNKVFSIDRIHHSSPVKKHLRRHIVIVFGEQDIKNVMETLQSAKWENTEIDFVCEGIEKHKERFRFVMRDVKNINFYSGIEHFYKTSSVFWIVFSRGEISFVEKFKTVDDFVIAEENSYIDFSKKNYVDDVSPCTSFIYNLNKMTNH